jgi:hypothetical protein
MNTFNKKSLCVALAAAGTLGAAGVAQAVNVSADGLGQVLIYPYYTVRNDSNGNAYNTLMSVVNTTSSTKAVKVRFREGKNSLEVLDFNVFLSPFDVWTGSITPTSAGGAQITTADKSCTIPSFYSNGVAQQVAFRTLTLESTDNGAARTSEGYFEIFEMATYDPASVVAINSKHTSAGVPADCSQVTDATAGIVADQLPPGGGLFGSEIILSPAGGGAFSQAATALDNFNNIPAYFNTGSTNPDVRECQPGDQQHDLGTRLYQTTWPVSRPRPDQRGHRGADGERDHQRIRAGRWLEVADELDRDVPDEVQLRQSWCECAVHVDLHHKVARAKTSTVSCSTAKRVRRRSSPAPTSRRSLARRPVPRCAGKLKASASAPAMCSARLTTPVLTQRPSQTDGRRWASTVSWFRTSMRLRLRPVQPSSSI